MTTTLTRTPVQRSRRAGVSSRIDWWAYAMIAPAAIGLAALYLWPFVTTFLKT